MTKSLLPFVAGLALWLGAPSARAAALHLNLGVDYVTPSQAMFDGTLGIGANLGRVVELGGRFGILFQPQGTQIGLPIDAYLRVHVPQSPLYIDGFAGPWVFFATDNVLRAHAGAGFGVELGPISLGVEASYLAPGATLGFRLGFNI
jgi:hypothetical protein